MINFKKQYLLLLFVAILSFQSYGQVFTGVSMRTENNAELDSKFKDYEIYSLNTGSINEYVKDDNFNYQIQFKFGDKEWNLELFPNDIRSGNFVHTMGMENGETKELKQENYSFFGHIKNGGNQKAVFTIMDEFVMGFIQDGGEEYFIEKAQYIDKNMSENAYIVYKASDVINDPTKTCGFDIYKHKKEEIDIKRLEELRKRRKDKVETRRDCWELDVALACDWAYVSKHGGNAAAEGFMFGILSLVSFNWDDEFTDEISVVGGATYSSACANCDPWSGTTNAGGLLNEFTNWGNGGGFNGGGYDDATLWTDRDFNGGTVGIAWLNGICNSARYNCCQDFTTGTNTLRQLQCHEMGHNYGLPHVSGPFIMAPSVNGSDTWSGGSIGLVNSYTPYGCMSECLGSVPPIADFTSNIQEDCIPFFVDFIDLSFENPTDWLWEFEGGSPSTSTLQNPTIEYRDKGVFQVRLTATNPNGSDTKTSFTYINALDVPEAIFSFEIDPNELNKVSFFDESVDPEEWDWDFDDGSISNDQYPVHTYDKDGEYYVTLTVTNLCGESFTEAFILIVTPVTAKFATDTISGCKSFYTTFADLSSKNVEFWKWEFPGGVPRTSTDKNPRVYYDTVGNHEVFLTVKNKFFEDTARIRKYIKVDSASIAGYIDSMDVDDSLKIDFMNESIYYDSITWSFEDTSFIDDSVTIYFASTDDTLRVAVDSNAEVTLSTVFHDDTLSAHYFLDSTYMVKIITHQHCGNDTVVKPVVVGKLPKADFELTTLQYCIGDEITLSDNSSPNTTRWEWKVTNVNGTNSYFEKNPKITLSDAGQYTIALIAKNGLGEHEITKMNYIEVVPQTVASFTQKINGRDVDFTSTAVNANAHAWNFGDNSSSSMANPSHNYILSGTYLVQYISINNCNSDTVELEVVIDDAPTASFGVANQIGCAPVDIQFTNTSSDNSTSWEWILEGGTPSSSSDENPLVKYENAGIFDVQLISINSIGRDTMKQVGFITIDDVPVAKFDYVDEDKKLTFSNNSTGSRLTYEWNFGDSNTSSEENPIHVYEMNGKYNVTLKVTNECGSNTFVKEVIVTTVSIKENDFVYSLTIAPNPTKGQFNIDVVGKANNEMNIDVISIFGKKVWSSIENFSTGSLSRSINVENVNNGTYFVVLRSKDKVSVRKIVIQH